MARAGSAAAAAMVGLLALWASPAAAQAGPAAPCDSLSGAVTPASAIGLPTSGARVVEARTVSDAERGSFCQVLGEIGPVDPAAPPIRFQVNLPDRWSGKAIHYGGGGYNGTVVNGLVNRYAPPGTPNPILQGYATFGSDSGHPADPRQPAAFALNVEALANFGRDQLKKTRDVAVALMVRRYGAAPRRTYFIGASQGGHEGFIVAQFHPADYDGVIAVHPVYNMTALQMNGVRMGQLLYARPGAWISPGQAAALQRAVLAACDGRDGLEDGIVSDPVGCRTAFRLQSLRCPGGRAAGEACLSDRQISTVRAIAGRQSFGFAIQGGVDGFSGWPILEGGETGARFHLGRKPDVSRPPDGEDGFTYFMGDQAIRYMIAQDPAYDSLSFRPGAFRARVREVSELVDANHADLTPFAERGGKLLLTHGTADMAVPYGNSVDYWRRLTARHGDRVRDFARFYVAPGFGHGDGPFVMSWNALEALDAWADGGRAPGAQTAIDTAPASAGRARPLCEHPAWPKYKGAGDVGRAESFACVVE